MCASTSARVAEVVILPDSFEKLFATQHDARMLRQLAQQTELRSCHATSSPPRRTTPASGTISTSPNTYRSDRRPRRPDPSQECSDASCQFLDLKRLRHVVVSPGLEPRHDVVGVRTRRDHDDRHVALLAQLAAELESVHPGKHQIDERDIRRLTAEQLERILCRDGLRDA